MHTTTFVEADDVRVGKRVAERQHRQAVRDFGERIERLRADALRRRIQRDQFRMQRLNRYQPVVQLVIQRVRNRRLIEHMIAMQVFVDLVAQCGDLLSGIVLNGHALLP